MTINKKTLAIYGGLAAAGTVALLAGVLTFALSPHGVNEFDAIAGGNPCVSIDQAKERAKFVLSEPPGQFGSRELRCIQPDVYAVKFLYAPGVLSAHDLSKEAMKKDDVMLVIVGDVTYGGMESFDSSSIFESNYQAVRSERPELEPQLLTIGGHLAWGREGGDTAMKVIVEDSEHNALSTSTKPLPALLEVDMGNNIWYRFEAFAPLSELIDAAESLK